MTFGIEIGVSVVVVVVVVVVVEVTKFLLLRPLFQERL